MDTPPDPGTPPRAPTTPAKVLDAQLIAALVIVAAMTLLGIGLMVTAYLLANWSIASLGVGAIIGALSTALNAPSGINSALRASKGSAQ